VGGFPELERQMCKFVAGGQAGSRAPTAWTRWSGR